MSNFVSFDDVKKGDVIVWYDKSYEDSYCSTSRGYIFTGTVVSRTKNRVRAKINESKGGNRDWNGPGTGLFVSELRYVTKPQYSHCRMTAMAALQLEFCRTVQILQHLVIHERSRVIRAQELPGCYEYQQAEEKLKELYKLKFIRENRHVHGFA